MIVATALLSVLFAAPPADEAPGYIGIQANPLTAELRTAHKIAKNVDGGLVLTQVFQKTAAAKAGLRVGDVLTSFDGKRVNTVDRLLELLKDKKSGHKVAYVARRGSGTIAGILVLGKRPAVPPSMGHTGGPKPPPPPKPNADAEMEMRVKALQAEMEVLRRRAIQKRDAARAKAMEAERAKVGRAPAKKKAGKRTPKRFGDWIAREERALVAAEEEKNVERIVWHTARLKLLAEMRENGLPQRAAKKGNDQKGAGRNVTDRRVAKLERRLNQILDRLEMLEASMKQNRPKQNRK